MRCLVNMGFTIWNHDLDLILLLQSQAHPRTYVQGYLVCEIEMVLSKIQTLAWTSLTDWLHWWACAVALFPQHSAPLSSEQYKAENFPCAYASRPNLLYHYWGTIQDFQPKTNYMPFEPGPRSWITSSPTELIQLPKSQDMALSSSTLDMPGHSPIIIPAVLCFLFSSRYPFFSFHYLPLLLSFFLLLMGPMYSFYNSAFSRWQPNISMTKSPLLSMEQFCLCSLLSFLP